MAAPQARPYFASVRFLRVVLSLVLALGILLGTSAEAFAKNGTLDITLIEFKSSVDKKDQKRIARTIRRQAHRTAKHLDFGVKGRVEVTFLVRDIQVVEEDDVVTVTCTLVGRLKGGGSARSKIRFGGKPDKNKKVERQVVTAATEGVLTRLAQLSRERAREDKKADAS